MKADFSSLQIFSPLSFSVLCGLSFPSAMIHIYPENELASHVDRGGKMTNKTKTSSIIKK